MASAGRGPTPRHDRWPNPARFYYASPKWPVNRLPTSPTTQYQSSLLTLTVTPSSPYLLPTVASRSLASSHLPSMASSSPSTSLPTGGGGNGAGCREQRRGRLRRRGGLAVVAAAREAGSSQRRRRREACQASRWPEVGRLTGWPGTEKALQARA